MTPEEVRPHFNDGETEAQRGYTPYPGLPSRSVATPLTSLSPTALPCLSMHDGALCFLGVFIDLW